MWIWKKIALITLIDKISLALDKGNFALEMFLDFRKAFDTVNHSILLRKLDKYGIRCVAHDWFKSFLSNRSQYVSYNDVNPCTKGVVCGVPQVSILGPVLFLLYVNDTINISPSLIPILFANDTNVFLKGKDINDLIIKINTEMQNVIDTASL